MQKGPGVWAAAAVCAAAGLIGTAHGQVFYEFTSGPTGDGFSWPASPTGLVDNDAFLTPDGVDFYNYTGNNVFFDSQYQVASNSGLINGDALWGNPQGGYVDVYFGGVQTLSFDYSQAASGDPFATPDYLELEIYDTEGRFTFEYFALDTSFTGFGGVDGWAGNVEINAYDLFDITGEYEENGEDPTFVDIEYVSFYLGALDTGGPTSEFAIDNLSVDGGDGGGDGELFPSVNNGANDITGVTTGTTWLRGTGTAGIGLEVTNGSGDNTTYSIQLNPGGDLSSGATVLGDAILDGETIFTPNVATVDRSMPAGEYNNDVTTINNGDASDPDNVSTLSIDLLDAPLLSGTAATVDVSAGQDPTLANASGTFRASVKFTPGSTTFTGGFELLNDFDDVRVRPGESASAEVGFVRYGQLSGTHFGTMTTGVEMTHYIVNEFVDFESFLGGAEAVADQTWNLSFNLADVSSDSQSISNAAELGHAVGVNSTDVAATFIDGTAAGTQTISMNFVPSPGDDASAGILGQAVDVEFGGTISPYTLEFTYNDLGGTLIESGLALLAYDDAEGEWVNAPDLNGGGFAQFFDGSYEDFVASNPSTIASNLGAYGLDSANNRVWAIINFEGAFAAGMLGGFGALEGDYNGDGFVSQGDLDLVLLNWGDAILPGGFDLAGIPGGGPFDGLISQNELDGVLLNWGDGTPPNFSAIPEPSSLGVALLAGSCLLRRRGAA